LPIALGAWFHPSCATSTCTGSTGRGTAETGSAARDRIREPPVAAAAAGEVDRAGREPVPGRLGRLFRFGNSAAFEKIRNYARMRLALFIAKRHRRSREFGWSVITCQSPNQLGLVTLSGTSSTPGPSGTGGLGRMPAVNGVGEACAGKPHARCAPRADPCKAGPRRGYRAQ